MVGAAGFEPATPTPPGYGASTVPTFVLKKQHNINKLKD
jgi:hypothetical protein